ncbi:2-hydroxychromene-2-carboxylate isomerase [Ideonella sp. BN130291]|uniref:2-hydroxychromene-2-carboxylate isomerase n=1 Tax=Ideonella sp. BN130291 TaxID=3112940 RepID=UPI002E25F800|nr:2-hydroxychromene-2-carboxylate isomerase [Ideonella sp. BN130291]
MSDPVIEFWFDFGSNYSYLSASRIEAAAQAAQVQVRWRPFLLGPIFKRLGWSSSPFVEQKEKGEYVWRDMERLALKYGVPWRRPTTFPRAAVYPMRVAVAYQEQPWVGAFCTRVMALNFAHDRDIHSNEVAAEVLQALGLDGERLVAEAQDHKARLREQSEEAARRRIFGAPTFFVGEEMFWGNDRLEDALAWARARGGAP